jgi:hypothetical protein
VKIFLFSFGFKLHNFSSLSIGEEPRAKASFKLHSSHSALSQPPIPNMNKFKEVWAKSKSTNIGAHASLELWCECLMLFGDMTKEGHWRAEESALVSVISACTHLGALDLGKCTHGSLLRNISGLNVQSHVPLWSMVERPKASSLLVVLGKGTLCLLIFSFFVKKCSQE